MLEWGWGCELKSRLISHRSAHVKVLRDNEIRQIGFETFIAEAPAFTPSLGVVIKSSQIRCKANLQRRDALLHLTRLTEEAATSVVVAKCAQRVIHSLSPHVITYNRCIICCCRQKPLRTGVYHPYGDDLIPSRLEASGALNSVSLERLAGFRATKS